MNRRQFMQYASAGSMPLLAAQAAPGVIRAGILGTQHSHTTGKLKAMKDSPDYEVVGVCENDPARASARKQNPLFRRPEMGERGRAARRPSLHLIVVECRVWEALPWGSKVIAAGKHLHLEKPPGQRVGAVQTNWWRKPGARKLLLQTGYLWRWHEGVNAAIDAARKGWLGEVFMVRGDDELRPRRGTARRRSEIPRRRALRTGGHVIDRDVELLGRPKKVKACCGTTPASPTSSPTTISRSSSTTRRWRSSRNRRACRARATTARSKSSGPTERSWSGREVEPAENARPHAKSARAVQGGLAGYHPAAAAAVHRRFPGTGARDQERSAAEALLRS